MAAASVLLIMPVITVTMVVTLQTGSSNLPLGEVFVSGDRPGSGRPGSGVRADAGPLVESDRPARSAALAEAAAWMLTLRSASPPGWGARRPDRAVAQTRPGGGTVLPASDPVQTNGPVLSVGASL